MTKPGLSIETAASVIVREFTLDHFAKFAHVVRTDRATNNSVTGEYINALAGAIALKIAGRHASKDDAINATMAKLRECVDRDLRHLAGT